MRLTCPNCSAQYEVDEAVIPHAGRDVQCSACGNAWFQYPREVALRMREAELDDDDDDDDFVDAGRTDGAAVAGGMAEAVAGAQPTRRIDQTVLDVLREEADREMEARSRSRQGIETQGELGLSRPQRSKAAPQRVYGEADPVEVERPEIPVEAPPESQGDTKRRRNLLPDIEELSSTLAPGSEAREYGDALDPDETAHESGGFGKGLTLVLLIALAFVMVYIFAPIIANFVPSLRGVLTSYVTLIDGARESIGTMLRGLIGG